MLRAVGDSNATGLLAGTPGATINAENCRYSSAWDLVFRVIQAEWGGIQSVTDDFVRVCKNLSLLIQMQL